MLIAADLANMHDTDTMAAIHGARISPLHAHAFGATSVIKSTIKPLVKPIAATEDSFGEEMEEDDDFSDHDSHYSEDFIDDDSYMHVITEEPPNVTQRLLSFAEMVNTDIQKYFGKKKDEDSCDIYEDKWVTTKSGRELYYADLLRIAQGENVDSKSRKSPNLDQGKQKFTGKMDAKIGLGPLNDLFEYGLRQFLVDGKLKAKKLKRMKQDVKKIEEVMPMNQRKLPDSFWREPGAERPTDPRVNNGGNMLNSSHPPDFSDLLQSWTGVGQVNDFGGELSSSEMSVTSSESL
ncbi:uncharacterized protein LOC110444865 [Mizuhopecten yessoensis]|uniref:uncharacterized protein LOC110444865 n=1 Tax=Mizuhopecten yessoensis TaxID=6573 RepID=UPI000B45CE16|nr:uncharacterized protein LOC110444865 [Mizuhopecten yessoensis]